MFSRVLVQLPRAENFHLPKPQSASFSSASHKSSRRNKLIISALGTKVFYMTLNFWLLQNMAACHCIFNRCVSPFNRLARSLRLWPEVLILLCAVTCSGPMSRGNWSLWSVDLLGHLVVLIGLGSEKCEFLSLKTSSIGG